MFWFWPWHGFLLWWLFVRGITTIIILVLVIWALTSWRRAPGGFIPGAGSSSARDILEERYAKGEIQREEYLQKKQDLN